MDMHRYSQETEALAQSMMRIALDRLRMDAPLDGPVDAQELGRRAGQTITPAGLGGEQALRVWTDVLAPATMSVDIRSNGQEALVNFEKLVVSAINEAVVEENRRWNSKAITVEMKLVGDRPAGVTPVDSPIIHAARAAFRSIGTEARSIAAASTDSNIAMSLGIPAITLSSAGQAGAAHSYGEWYAPSNNWYGPQLVLMVTLGLVGVEGVSEPLLEKRAK